MSTVPVVERRLGRVLELTMDNPAQRNALTPDTSQTLTRLLRLAHDDAGIGAIVLRGEGEHFCAGGNLKTLSEMRATQPPQAIVARINHVNELARALRGIGKPVIAAVEGHALAGGCELALVADLIVASRESEFGIPEPKRGLVAAAGGVLRLSRRLPRNVAMELALTGDPMPAPRLAELGLVNRLADAGKALDVAVELAEKIVANAPISVAVSKQIIEEAPGWPPDEEFRRQSELAARAVLSADAREGVAAFAEHRDPVWSGR